jgi:hypothetical protein
MQSRFACKRYKKANVSECQRKCKRDDTAGLTNNGEVLDPTDNAASYRSKNARLEFEWAKQMASRVQERNGSRLGSKF